MCGEKRYVINCSDNDIGSPPHVRGKADLKNVTDPHIRITPACAGKSISYFKAFVNS